MQLVKNDELMKTFVTRINGTLLTNSNLESGLRNSMNFNQNIVVV